MNALFSAVRLRAAATACRALRFPTLRHTPFIRSFAILPKRNDTETSTPPPGRTYHRPRMPSSVVTRRSPEAAAATAAPPQSSHEAELRSMSVAELKTLAAARGISTSGFFDKDDFVRALQTAVSRPGPAAAALTPANASHPSTTGTHPPRPFANMPVDDPDSQLQVNENPSEEVVHQGLGVLMAQPYVMIKRRMEMLNFMIGFEQNNQYTIYGAAGDVVGYVVEESQGLMGMAVRNVAHTHRPFKARVMDPQGNVIMKVFRGFFFFKSSLTVARYDGSVVGEVEQEFTVLRRKYSLFTKDSPDGSQQQFGLVNAPTLSLNFNVEDDNYNVIAAVDRDFSSFGQVISSMFLDKNTYIVHFSTENNQLYRDRLSYVNTPDGSASFFSTDKSPEERARENPKILSASQRHVGDGQSSVASSDKNSDIAESPSVPSSPAQLTMQQKAVVLGAAISIDFDYFSRHSSSSNHGVLGGMGGMFGGFGGGDSGGHSSSSSDHSSTPDHPSDAGSSSSGSSGSGSEQAPSHGKYGEELDRDTSDTMEDKWDVFSDD